MSYNFAVKYEFRASQMRVPRSVKGASERTVGSFEN